MTSKNNTPPDPPKIEYDDDAATSSAAMSADDYIDIVDSAISPPSKRNENVPSATAKAEPKAANGNVTGDGLVFRQAREFPHNTIKDWPVRKLSDAYKPREPIKYFVDGLFAESSLNIVYGSPGSKKSMVLADCCTCVAAGLPWLSPIPNVETKVRPLATQQTPILWVDFDNGLRRTDERFDAMASVRGLQEDTPINYVSMPQPWLDASSRSEINQLAKLSESLKAKVIVIDNLGLITGSVEENSAEMSTVMGNLRWLAESTKSAVIVIHHQRKSSGNGGGRKGDTLRGHSSIEASLDLALLIDCPDGSDEITLTPTKVRGPDPRKIGALFVYKHREGTKELGEARFFGWEAEDLKDDAAIDEATIDALTQFETMNKTTLVTMVKESTDIGANAIRKRIDYMSRENIIHLQDKGNGKSKLYSLAQKP